MTTTWTTLKETRWTETENTRYGLYEKRMIKKFITNGESIIETTYSNGIITFSAMYPADTEYANSRMN